MALWGWSQAWKGAEEGSKAAGRGQSDTIYVFAHSSYVQRADGELWKSKVV